MGKEINEPDPLKGFLDDAADLAGVFRPDEFLPVPRDLVHALGLPTLKEAVPSPKDIGDSITSKRSMPKFPPFPTPKEFVERVQ